MTGYQGDRDGQEGELDVQVAGALHSSVDRRFRVWEDVAWGFSADRNEDLPAVRRVVSNTTWVELGALHHELSVDPLVWCADLGMEKQWHLTNVVHRQKSATPLPRKTNEIGRRSVYGGAREMDPEQC